MRLDATLFTFLENYVRIRAPPKSARKDGRGGATDVPGAAGGRFERLEFGFVGREGLWIPAMGDF
jgi:hypothetical protein